MYGTTLQLYCNAVNYFFELTLVGRRCRGTCSGCAGEPLSQYACRMKDWKRSVWLWGLALTVGLYKTFALLLLWNWFAVSVLPVPALSYWQMCGLQLLVSALFDRSADDYGNEQRWK